jgi:phage tail-like protein
MDANGTRFWMLLGERDWGECTSPDGVPLRATWPDADSAGLDWDAKRHDLTLRSQVPRFSRAPQPADLQLERRRGAARDRYGSWYWIDASERGLRAWSSGSERASHFWSPDDIECATTAPAPGTFAPPTSPPPPAAARLRGLAITADHYLVVGVDAEAADPGGLLVFDLHAGGGPRRIRWPADVPLHPFDIAALPNGGVLVLDRAARRYWALDRHLHVVPLGTGNYDLTAEQIEAFQPLAGLQRRRAARRFPASGDLRAAAAAFSADPIAIAALPDGTALVLIDDPTQRFSAVARFRDGALVGPPATLEAILGEVEADTDFTLRAYDMALLPGEPGEEPTLYVVAADGNQAFAFRVGVAEAGLTLTPEREYLPLRLFSARAIVAAAGRVYYDFGERWLPLVPQTRPRYLAEATLLTWVFDSRTPGCVWHRLMLDACLPADTGVRIWSSAADDPDMLTTDDPQHSALLATNELALLGSHGRWQREPVPVLRRSGSELPYLSAPVGERSGTYELLFQNARGRYLQLKIALIGSTRAAPRLRALRAYYPRFSYLERYLPAAYREEPLSAAFMDRFLANFEGILTTIEDRIAAANLLIDIRSAPPATLEWLAGWFEVALDPAWEEERRRLFIANAMTFFQWRGTARGIQMALRLAFDRCVDPSIFAPTSDRKVGYRVIEQFRTRSVPPVAIGDASDPGGPLIATTNVAWSPALGAADLDLRYRAALGESDTTVRFPLRDPGSAQSPLWQAFARATLGFVPAAAPPEAALWQAYLQTTYGTVEELQKTYGSDHDSFADVPLPTSAPTEPAAADWLSFTITLATTPDTITWLRWQQFLTHRYQRVRALNESYGSSWPALAAVPLPHFAPTSTAALIDWYLFESRVLPMHRVAHQFRVLLPTPVADLTDRGQLEAVQQEQLRLARRVVELEKPAHTEFSVRFYWAMFRLGEARLGDDTLLDLGGRSIFLNPPAALDQVYLGETSLAAGHPLDIPDRLVAGRDQLPARGTLPQPATLDATFAKPRSHI